MVATESDIEALPPIVEFTREESRTNFDSIATARLGLSGEEFLRRLDAGEYEEIVDDPIDHPWVGYLAHLSAYVR